VLARFHSDEKHKTNSSLEREKKKKKMCTFVLTGAKHGIEED
jgi:hypothetical protein